MHEENWQIARTCLPLSVIYHLILLFYADRVLMPVFGTLAVQGMLEDMIDICTQLLLKASGQLLILLYFSPFAFTSGNGGFNVCVYAFVHR